MTNFKTLGSVLFCICLSYSLGSSSWAQQFFTPAPSRRPIFDGRLLQQRPVQPNQQRRVVPSLPVQQRSAVRSQADSQFFHPSQTNSARITGSTTRLQVPSVVQPKPTPTQPATDSSSMGLARAKIAELKEEIEELKNLNTELQSDEKGNEDLKDAETKIEDLNGRIKDLTELNMQLKTQVKRETEDDQKLNDAKLKIAELEKSLQDMKASQTKSKADDNAAEVATEKISIANAKLQTETEQLKNANGSMKAKLAELNEQLKQSSEKMSQNVEAQKEQIQKLESQVEAAVEKSEALAGRVDTLVQENEELKALRTPDAMANSEQNESNLKLPELEAKIQSLTTQNGTLAEQNQELSDSKEKLEADITAVREQSAAMQAQFEAVANEKDLLDERVKELAARNQQYMSSSDQFKDLNQQLAETNKKLEAKIAAASGKTDSIQTRQQAATKENENHGQRIAELSLKKKENQELLKANEKLNADVDAAREKSEALQAQYQTFTKEKSVLSKRIAELVKLNKGYLNEINLLKLKTSAKTGVKTESEKFELLAEDLPQSPVVSKTKPAEASLPTAKPNKDKANQQSASALLLDELPTQAADLQPLDEGSGSPIAPVEKVTDAAGWGNRDVLVWLVPLLAMLFAIGIFSLFREDYSRKSKDN